MHKCTHVACFVHTYMHTCKYACTHAYMRVCAERRIFLTDTVCLDGNRGTIYCLPDIYTIIHNKVSYSRRALKSGCRPLHPLHCYVL